ncbi:MAG: PAS domain-containing sensor histidine kinase [Euryarchaeota archaeon]|nr:PAS domain-containing sensor histidine kinase [Euryarchaeota archaeon]MCG2735820.1 PAS domain-containing sensor histidine kinase [Candidatus Methanoperedenaceae archaeon]
MQIGTSNEKLIEERRRELWENTDFLRAVFENLTGYGVIAADFDGNVIAYNKGAHKIYGYAPEEIINKENIIIFYTKEFIDMGGLQMVVDFLLGKGSFSYEAEMVRKNGEKFPAKVQFTLTKDKNGKLVGFVELVEDLSELKRTEELYLENMRLLVANRAKSEFLAVMSHELRTPLNSIIGFSELLKHGDLNEKEGHFVENVLISGKHLLSLVNGILDLVNIETGKVELVLEKMSVPLTIDESLLMIKSNAEKHNIILKKEIDPELDHIVADRQKFKQILLNLLDNAVKFNKPAGGIVTVSAKKVGDMAMISVSDTGIGIKEEDMEKLFKEFEQLDKGTSRKYGGTGLGLTISKKLVELHGGKIKIESKYGEGSTFAFSIPLVTTK